MIASVLTIGDEILIGQIVDTNSAWIAQKLNEIGIRVCAKISAADTQNSIVDALNFAKQKSDLIIITGGLGATKDDITKKTLAGYFDLELYFHQETYDRMHGFFAKVGRTVSEMNRNSCYMPYDAIILNNEKGLAPAIWIEKENKIFISLPGVPFEMKHLLEDKVFPKLKLVAHISPIVHRTILTAGEGETQIAEKLGDFENILPSHIKLAYLPTLGTVRLRLTALGESEEVLEKELDFFEKQLLDTLGDLVYGFGENNLPNAIGTILKNKKLTLGTVESCTGGNIARLITLNPGASTYYFGSIVSYHNSVKTNLLQVDENELIQNGAVSESTVIAMVKGGLTKIGVDIVVATSGIMGPDGGSELKPVGTAWIAVGNSENIVAKKIFMNRGRDINIEYTSIVALNMLRKFLLEA
jgi:nicotinamide-nucleotide amidase